jgi:phage terminase small subunit
MAGQFTHPETGLTELQERFLCKYMETGKVRESAEWAGYAKASADVQGAKALRNPAVVRELQRRGHQAIDKTLVTPEYVLIRLRHLAEKCLQDAPILDAEGQPTGRTRCEDAPGAARALELLGKHLRLFVDRVEIDASDELAERIERARQRLALKTIDAVVEKAEGITMSDNVQYVPSATPDPSPQADADTGPAAL